jgi:hypothetical protein
MKKRPRKSPASYKNASISQVGYGFNSVVVRSHMGVNACAHVAHPNRAIDATTEALAICATKTNVKHCSLVQVLMHLNVLRSVVQPYAVVPR